MAEQIITVTDDGIESVEMVIKSVADGVAAGRLTEKTALALRLLHQAAKSELLPTGISTEPPVSYSSSIPQGTDFERGLVLGTLCFGAHVVGNSTVRGRKLDTRQSVTSNFATPMYSSKRIPKNLKMWSKP